MFLIAKMSQDLVYDVLFFNTRNDSHRTTAPATDLELASLAVLALHSLNTSRVVRAGMAVPAERPRLAGACRPVSKNPFGHSWQGAVPYWCRNIVSASYWCLPLPELSDDLISRHLLV
jgi:hypothetical protein